jgi:hypothetical protein
MKCLGKLGEDGGGVLLAGTGEHRYVWLITNRGSDHANLFWRLASAIDRLRIPPPPAPVVIKIGKGLQRWRSAVPFSHDQNSARAG